MFAAGPGLRIRMYLALALNALILAALLAGLVALTLFVDDGWAVALFFIAFALIGALSGRNVKEYRLSIDEFDFDRATRAVGRLSLLADVPVPEIKDEPRGPPLTWTTALPGRAPRIHVTRELLEQLDDTQLEAALAHEISHIANRDAVLMTVLAAPGIYVLRGMVLTWTDAELHQKFGVLMMCLMFVVPAALSAAVARIVSRHRELAADRGAAMLTGSPAAVISALLRVSGEIAVIPRKDLRRHATQDLLNIVPVRRERALLATHPRLTTRVRELERLEERLQAG
jgi:heat shock protein HtpX